MIRPGWHPPALIDPDDYMAQDSADQTCTRCGVESATALRGITVLELVDRELSCWFPVCEACLVAFWRWVGSK